MTPINRVIGPMIATDFTGRIIARLFRDRIPHRGLTIDTSSPQVAAQTKAALLVRGYESSEYRFLKRYLPRDVDVLELGGSLGIISCTIRRRINADRTLVVVEANPELAKVLRRNLILNGCDANTHVVEAAISYDGGPTVRFGLGETSVSGRVSHHPEAENTIDVPSTTLSGLLSDYALTDYAIVSDVEGVEWAMVQHDFPALEKARIIIMETHAHADHGSHDALIKRLTDTGKFNLVDQHGAVIVLTPAGRD